MASEITLLKALVPNKPYDAVPDAISADGHTITLSGDEAKILFHVIADATSDNFTLTVLKGDFSDSAIGDLEIACVADDDKYFTIETSRFKTKEGTVELTVTTAELETAVGTIEAIRLPL